MRGFRGHDGRDDSRHNGRHDSRKGGGAARATESRRPRRRTAGSLLLWIPGKALAQPVTAWGYAASAALLIAVGEAGEGVRQRLRRRVRRAA
ncbi:hypothetical protein AB0D54_17210 [Streptomyces xanthophaeus]|uniref:hypothetical protein n=1 Tax=Streptomyces xanthophaeus TaxID=67385 RepID=UPI00341E1141